MKWLWLLLLIILGVANVFIAGAVLARDFKKLNNVAFAIFALSIASWVIGIAGFSVTDTSHAALQWAQLYYVAPLIIAVSGMTFVLSFPSSGSIKHPLMYASVIGFCLLFFPIAFDQSSLILGLVHHPWGKEVVLRHFVYALYCMYVTFFFTAVLVVMHVKSRKLQGVYALQARLFFEGLSVTATFGLLFNLVLPFLGNYRLIGVGPLFTSISVTALGYAIVRHRMFDIRLVVARSLGYLLSLVTLAFVYGLVVFGIANFAFNLHFSFGSQIFLSFATSFAAILLNRIRKYFDRITNRIFYRDAYDAQDLFDRLNAILVSTLDLDILLHQLSDLLAVSIKAEFCLMGLKEVAGRPQRIIGTQKRDIPFQDIMKARKATVKIHQSVIVADNLEENAHAELRHLLRQNNIAVIVRLAPNISKNEEGLGYIVLGPKKSGNPYNNQDIRVLDTIANELIIAIQNALHFEEIQRFNITLQSKVDEATRKLRRTNAKLEALDETKDDFISMASHQLRTPLTSVKGYLSMVLDGDAGAISETQRKMLGQAFISSQRMVYLIADLLNVSRLKTGKFVIETQPVDLSKMIDEEITPLMETAQAREITLSYHKPANFPLLMIDETKTRQVIMNFVDNAIYYTKPGGHIKVLLEDKPSSVELKVVDDGIGVPVAEQHHLFTKFYRARNAQQARPDGTGLGLFMAKKVVVAQGGAILFDSQEGKGSTFGFVFSKTKLQPPVAQPAESV